VLEERRGLEDQYLAAATRLARLRFRRAEYSAAHGVAERALAVDNSLEEVHEIAIRALISSGNVSEARLHVDSYATYLREELDAELPKALADLVSASPDGRRLAAV